MSADMLRGIAIGSLVLTGFGALWLVLGIRFLLGFDWRVLFGLGLIALALVSGALRVWSAAQHLTPGPSSGENVAGPAFGIVTTVEFGLIFATVLVCRLAGRGELILPIIALIVGLHFIPLAAIFGVRIYYVTGIAIVLAVLASFFAPSEGLRQAVASLGCGSVLWLTSAFLLLRS